MTYCLIRKREVALTSEEKVRQALLSFLIDQGYPPALIAVEKSLLSLPQKSPIAPPKRRIDIVVYNNDLTSPFLLIECKAGALTSSAMRQLIGYNVSIGAPYIALSNGIQTKTGSYSPNIGWIFTEGLPKYISQQIKNKNLEILN